MMQAHLTTSLNIYVVENFWLRELCHEFVILLWKAEKDIRSKVKRMAESEMDCNLKKMDQPFQVLP